jgi:hypothetical protein
MAGLKKNGDPAAAMGAGRGGNKKGVMQQTGRQKMLIPKTGTYIRKPGIEPRLLDR